MKNIVTALLLLSLSVAPAFAAAPGGGVAGHIVDATTGKPLAGIPLEIFRLPVRRGDVALKILKSDRHGFFADVSLPPGRYIFATAVVGLKTACEIDDVYAASQTNLRLAISEKSATCTGPGVHTAMVNSALLSDVTIVR